MNGWYWLLGAVQLVGLALVPLGLPGLWLMLAAGIGYKLLVAGTGLSWLALGIVAAIAVVAEILEFTLSVKYTKKYGGSRRAGWGALLGGLIGAVMGVPVPIIGSVIGAFLGSFLGALAAEYSLARDSRVAGRSAWGALVGRVAATAVKTALGAAIAAILMVGAWPGSGP
ncbi:MAG: DUF456 domain-containing protein [Gemmatimonadetes bacterium]|nr:DUF456 domain-containing protein [Gemmatimonadota bacterium]